MSIIIQYNLLEWARSQCLFSGFAVLRMHRWNFPVANRTDWGRVRLLIRAQVVIRVTGRNMEGRLGKMKVRHLFTQSCSIFLTHHRHSHDKHTQRAESKYLAGSDDEAILVLVFQVFGVFQFFPVDAYGHRTQLIICSKVV